MSDTYADVARRVAAKLAEPLAPGLPQKVERLLSDRQESGTPEKFDPTLGVALAALVISAASLGWTIYQDLKKGGTKVRRDDVIRRLRVKIGNVEGVQTADRDRAIEVVVEEIETESATDA